MPKVWNKEDPHCPKGPTTSYVGRPSKYGNPYPIGFMSLDRSGVVEAYGQWLQQQIKTSSLTLEELKRDLRGKDLICWCAPQLCHADILLKLANED